MIEEILKKYNLDAILFFSPENRFWLTGFRSSLGYLIVTSQTKYLFVDGRYITDAQKKLADKNIEICLWKNWEEIKIFLEKKAIKNIGFEKDYITVAKLAKWKKEVFTVNWIGIETNKMRMIKNAQEIEYIRQAGRITDQTYQKLLQTVKVGMKEKDISIIILNTMKELGVEELSFDTIVVSGIRGSLPHGTPSEKIVQVGELVTVDFGGKYKGYCSDFTRTFAVGKLFNPQLVQIHQIVREAQWKGIQAVKTGVKTSEIDQVVRNYIKEKGYGEFFSHSTGHGLGIEVHEAPWVSSHDNTILQIGMIITIEPGIYVPNLGGVRIEDDILVTENGYELLTNTPRELIYVQN